MTPDKIIVAVLCLFGIMFIYWYFLRRKTIVTTVDASVDILVDGGYSPEVITIKKGKKVDIHFLRKDPSSCLEEVLIPEFNIKKYLPLNKITTITIEPENAGSFQFSCGMNMFHGKIIVE